MTLRESISYNTNEPWTAIAVVITASSIITSTKTLYMSSAIYRYQNINPHIRSSDTQHSE